MLYSMPPLPYPHDSLEPVISSETLDFHYGKHLQTYVHNLNSLVKDTSFDGLAVEDIVRTAPEGPLFDNAGQVLNHTMYFRQFSPLPRQKEPGGVLAERINRDFGSFGRMKEQLEEAAVSLFGSGWAWLCADPDGRLMIVREANGGNPLCAGCTPLLGVDVWEHAYYLDYRNRRADHVKRLWEIVDWVAVEQLFVPLF